MKTPSHAILNLAGLSLIAPPELASIIVLGAILPDVPIFGLYFWAKGFTNYSDAEIWGDLYQRKFWQNSVAFFHSFVLTGGLLAIALSLQIPWLTYLSASMVLHNVGDFPVHNDDAHRHFFPVSAYRFISPLSYWDPRHFGRDVSRVENGLVILACGCLFFLSKQLWIQALCAVFSAIYLVFLYYAWGNVCAQNSNSQEI